MKDPNWSWYSHRKGPRIFLAHHLHNFYSWLFYGRVNVVYPAEATALTKIGWRRGWLWFFGRTSGYKNCQVVIAPRGSTLQEPGGGFDVRHTPRWLVNQAQGPRRYLFSTHNKAMVVSTCNNPYIGQPT